MKTKIIFSFLFLCLNLFLCYSQVPQGINYQAVAKDGFGMPISNKDLVVKVSILTDTTGFFASGNGTYIWEEQHSVKTNSSGLFNLVIGTMSKVQGSATSFSTIDWNVGELFVGVKIQYPSNTWRNMGTAKLNSVPYAMVANGVATGSKLAVVSSDDASVDALFEVKRQDGQTVFAVYPDAVSVYIPQTNGKGIKGGFSIGGYNTSKAVTQDYFRVTPDSVRIYIDPTPSSKKGIKGGFSIGGYNTSKGNSNMYFNLTGSSSVNTVDESPQILWYPTKKAFLAGSIHIGGADSVGKNSTALGYRSIAMGDFSQAFGYRAKAFGQYSTSIGKNSVAGSALADNAFAFGSGTMATGNNSIAIGMGAEATDTNAMALGVNSLASGLAAISMGSNSQSTNENSLSLGNESISAGKNATSIGFKSRANGELSLAIGSFFTYSFDALPYFTGTTNVDTLDFIIRDPIVLPSFKTITFNRANIANGKFSMSIGNGNLSNNGGMAIGSNNNAMAFGAVALGVSNKAVNTNAFAAGYENIATGFYSTAFGNNSYSKAYGSFVIGQYNIIVGDSTKWIDTDPLFIVGNGLNPADRSNALTIFKNGRSVFKGAHANVSLNDKITRLMFIPGVGLLTKKSVYGVKSYVNRSDNDVDYYYSGYFYNTGTAGTYKGLYADLINTNEINTDKINGVDADVAEYYLDSDANTEPGDVVVADIKNKVSVVKSVKPYQTSVLGIISTEPGMVMGFELVLDEKTGEPKKDVNATRLALTGRVPVKVTNENGPIVPGDLLTTSSTPGHAMKWSLLDVTKAAEFESLKTMLAENERRRNAIIGKAVESFSGTTGKIMVLVSLQ